MGAIHQGRAVSDPRGPKPSEIRAMLARNPESNSAILAGAWRERSQWELFGPPGMVHGDVHWDSEGNVIRDNRMVRYVPEA